MGPFSVGDTPFCLGFSPKWEYLSGDQVSKVGGLEFTLWRYYSCYFWREKQEKARLYRSPLISQDLRCSLMSIRKAPENPDNSIRTPRYSVSSTQWVCKQPTPFSTSCQTVSVSFSIYICFLPFRDRCVCLSSVFRQCRKCVDSYYQQMPKRTPSNNLTR